MTIEFERMCKDCQRWYEDHHAGLSDPDFFIVCTHQNKDSVAAMDRISIKDRPPKRDAILMGWRGDGSGDIIKFHEMRKRRVGQKWWGFLKQLKEGGKISGKEAMFLCDSYGIRSSDLIFWMDVIGVSVNLEEFLEEIKEKVHRQSLVVPC